MDLKDFLKILGQRADKGVRNFGRSVRGGKSRAKDVSKVQDVAKNMKRSPDVDPMEFNMRKKRRMAKALENANKRRDRLAGYGTGAAAVAAPPTLAYGANQLQNPNQDEDDTGYSKSDLFG